VVAGDVDTGPDDGGAGKPDAENEENDDTQAGGEVDADSGSGDSDETGTVMDEEATTDLGTSDAETDVDDSESGSGLTPTDEAAGELDGENQTVEQEDSDQAQDTDFEPPPGELPVTGIILNWNIAPIVAISVVILLALVGTGVSALFSPKRRRY
jgi:hypothetical protein